jgi:hypothetical protein
MPEGGSALKGGAADLLCENTRLHLHRLPPPAPANPKAAEDRRTTKRKRPAVQFSRLREFALRTPDKATQ